MKQWLAKGLGQAAAGRKQGPGGASAAGYVDGFGPKYVWGWTPWESSEPPRVAIACDDDVREVPVRWVERADLKAAGKVTVGKPGFQFGLPLEFVSRLVSNPALKDRMAVLVNGRPLPFAKGAPFNMPDGQAWNEFPAELQVRSDGTDLLADTWASQFCVFARFPDAVNAPADVTLVCNGEPVANAGVRYEREVKVSGRKAPVQETEVVFEFELPGTGWESSDGDVISVAFDIAGARFPAVPLAVTLDKAIEWLEMQAKDGPHETYPQMLALEHARFIVARTTLPGWVVEYLEEAAGEHGLEGYLPLPDVAGRVKTPEPVVDGKAMLLARALREYNEQMPQWEGREAELMKQVGDSLPPKTRVDFIQSVAPYFFATGRFDVIRPLISPARIAEMASWNDTFPASFALPFMVADGQVEAAAKILFKFAEDKGWLSSDALAVASQIVEANAHLQPEHEQFVYALIAMLDSKGRECWPRHQDTQLINALCVWFERPDFRTEWLLRDLLKAALRNYGLSDGFWSRMQVVLATGNPLLRDLHEARRCYTAIRDSLPRWHEGGADDAALHEAVAYFRRVGCHDLPILLREWIANGLLSATDTASAVARLPLQDLLAIDPREGVRLAALPLADDSPVTQRLPALRQTVLTMQGDIGRTDRYALQCRVGALLRAIESAGTGEREVAVDELLRAAEPLGDAGRHYLSADILARLCLLLAGSDSAATVARAFVRFAQQGVEDLDEAATTWPQQPLLAGLATMDAVVAAHADARLTSGLQQVRSLMAQSVRGEKALALEAALTVPATLRMKAPAGRDTLVVVYSCRKYLDTRVQAMRDTWLRDLSARGIPFVVLVGDGNDQLDGDVLALKVSDRYEDLPAKTFAMVRWVATYTDFQYLLKVDDDCFLNVDEYFDSLSYRKYHYYGRVINRALGSMDRKWHQEKSQGARARNAIDKSPEPARYADGGGAYSLSRLAMTQVLAQAETLPGKRLVASSYMEDKLVGDLLAMAGFQVSNEDYYTLVRRRFGSNATPVAIWDNTFVPSRFSPVKLAHLDAADAMQPCYEKLHASSLWPRKIWPTYARPGIWFNDNQLELLSPVDDARRLLAEPLCVVAVMRNEAVMLPHFLAHYRKLGVKAFIIVDNVSDDGTRETLLKQPDVVVYSADTEYRESTFGVAWQQAVLANHCVGKWALVADADELLVYPDCENVPLADFVAAADAGGFDAVRVHMVDMYPFGDLADADFTRAAPFEAAPWFDRQPLRLWRLGQGTFSNAPNHVSALRHRLMPTAEPHNFTAQKFCLVRYAPWMRFSAGLHNVANARVLPEPIAFAHFKYHAGFKEKVEEEVQRKQHFGDAQEYRKYLGMLMEGRGRFGVEGISARYAGSHAFVAAARGDAAE